MTGSPLHQFGTFDFRGKFCRWTDSIATGSDASGQSTVSITVLDERQNAWTNSFDVFISEIDDAPEMDELPVELTMELNQPLSIPFSYWDRDTPSSQLSIEITPDWATFSGGEITFDPTQFGVKTVTVKVTDG